MGVLSEHIWGYHTYNIQLIMMTIHYDVQWDNRKSSFEPS